MGRLKINNRISEEEFKKQAVRVLKQNGLMGKAYVVDESIRAIHSKAKNPTMLFPTLLSFMFHLYNVSQREMNELVTTVIQVNFNSAITEWKEKHKKKIWYR